VQIVPLAQVVPAAPQPVWQAPLTQTWPVAQAVPVPQALLAWHTPAALQVCPLGHGTFGLHWVWVAHWPLVQTWPLAQGTVAVH